jgi:biotin transport system substrate-specific component
MERKPIMAQTLPAPATAGWMPLAARGALAVAALTAAAHIQVPFWPVSVSMQTFVVLALPLFFGARFAVASIVAWLTLGIAGLPVFQSGAGPAYLVGPTGGFLLGFVVAAAVVGTLVDRNRITGAMSAALAVLAGLAIIFVPGIAWLSALFGFEQALAFGLTPFVPGEIVKGALLVALFAVHKGRAAQ